MKQKFYLLPLLFFKRNEFIKKIAATFFLIFLSIFSNAQYCSWPVNSIGDEDITLVQINGENGTSISNITTCSPPNAAVSSQSNYYGTISGNKESKLIAPLVLLSGKFYTITVQISWCNSNSYSNFTKVWIDFNGNNIFEETSELVFANSDIRQSNSANNGPVTFTSTPFQIPNTTKAGLTRMRVVNFENAGATVMPTPLTACSGATWGEVEDYDVTISPNIFSICKNGSIYPNGFNSFLNGASQKYTFLPNEGYIIDSVIVDGIKVDSLISYTFNNIITDHSIRVIYRMSLAALAAANICSNDTIVSTVNLPATSLVRATTYYSNIYLFNQNNTGNAYKYNVNDRKYTAIADKPTACIECGVAEANGKVYCFNTNGTNQAYDIASNTWQTQTNQPSSSTSSVYAASINNKIYVLGYNNNQNTFIQYNPQTNSYTALSSPTTSSSQSRLVAYNNKLYKIGGTDNNNQPTSSVEVYNPSNNTWTAMPDLPVALSQVGATYYDNKLYVFGGKQASNSNSNKVYVFDFTSNAWYAESNTQNTNRTNIETKTANNMVFLFGGTDTSNTQTNQAQRYFCKDQLCTCKWAEYVCAGVSSDMPCNTLSPTIQNMQQDTTTITGNLYNGTAANNVTVTLNYTGANGAAYNARNINSTGVTGLTATLIAGILNNGDGLLTFSISGTPNTTGTANFSVTIGGKTCVFTKVVNAFPSMYKAGTVFCNGTPTEVVELTDPLTGMVWMDRNLGASRAALSEDDTLAYGDLYQWGRGADGHQCRNSATTTTLSTTEQPGHNKFIVQLSQTWPFDWQSNPNFNLWQGTEGINNPCPTGFRVPNYFDFNKTIRAWFQAGLFNNSNVNHLGFQYLKLVNSGIRYIDGTIPYLGDFGEYWTSTTRVWSSVPNYSTYVSLSFNVYDGGGTEDDYMFNNGLSVRCLKDESNSTIGSINSLELDTSFVDPYTPEKLYKNLENNSNFRLRYTGGNGRIYPSFSVQSSGILGLKANVSSDTLSNGNGTISMSITGVTSSTGKADFTFNIGGQDFLISLNVVEFLKVNCSGDTTKIVEVTNPITGKTWMDRNLGSKRNAISSNDSLAYGDLYQWGRIGEGHQCRNSQTESSLFTIEPLNGKFIVSSYSPKDWKTPQNDNLWQGVNGINNPCPEGYRVPTQAEFESELNSWIQKNKNGAFNSTLKLPTAGMRTNFGIIQSAGSSGSYWTSEVNVENAVSINFGSINASISPLARANGLSVRCIKD